MLVVWTLCQSLILYIYCNHHIWYWWWESKNQRWNQIIWGGNNRQSDQGGILPPDVSAGLWVQCYCSTCVWPSRGQDSVATHKDIWSPAWLRERAHTMQYVPRIWDIPWEIFQNVAQTMIVCCTNYAKSCTNYHFYGCTNYSLQIGFGVLQFYYDHQQGLGIVSGHCLEM